MKKKDKSLFLLIFYGIVSSPSFADDTCGASAVCNAPRGGVTHSVENRVYAGFEWPFGAGQSFAPKMVFGLRSLTIKDSNAVSGGDLSLRFDVLHQWKLDSIRLAYVGGDRDVQGNIGGGYSFTDAQPLVTAVIQSSYARIGTDYVYGVRALRPYIELNSMEKPKQISNSKLTCSSGYSLSSASSTGATSAQSTNGKTCVQPLTTPPINVPGNFG